MLAFYAKCRQIHKIGPWGLTMNRVIGSLRKSAAVNWANHTVTIVDWRLLAQMAEFDPTYLSMTNEPR